MDFTLDQKHEMARDLFKQFAETEVKPLAQETDETEVFPAETVAKMGNMDSWAFLYQRSTADRAVIHLHTLCV